MRALLDLLRENEAAVQGKQAQCKQLLADCMRLKVLDLEHGEKELVRCVLVQMAKLVG